MQFYNDTITQKSFSYLQSMRKKYDFILIGGWAVYLYSKNLKSKDIDIIIDYDVLAGLKETEEVFKNERLSKYEINAGYFDVDIYLPHYSKLGVEVEEIKKHIANKDGFVVPVLEILFLMKLFAWHNRRGSSKGQKDELDIIGLAVLPEFDWKKYLKFVKKYNFSNYSEEFIKFLKKVCNAKELNINEQKMAKTKKRIFRETGSAY